MHDGIEVSRLEQRFAREVSRIARNEGVLIVYWFQAHHHTCAITRQKLICANALTAVRTGLYTWDDFRKMA